MKRNQLVHIFFSNDERTWPLNGDLLYLILEIAGLAKYGTQCSLFTIFFRPSNKWREKRKQKKLVASANRRRGISML